MLKASLESHRETHKSGNTLAVLDRKATDKTGVVAWWQEVEGADREMHLFSQSSWTAGVGGTQKPPLLQSSLCHHLDAILKPSAPAPHVNKVTTPNMLASLNGLFLAGADPKMANSVGWDSEPEWLTDWITEDWACVRHYSSICVQNMLCCPLSQLCQQQGFQRSNWWH